MMHDGSGLAPLLFGAFLLMAVQRGLVLWQQDRSRRLLVSMSLYIALAAVYLGNTLAWPAVAGNVLRLLLLLILLALNFVEWRRVILFLTAKAGVHGGKDQTVKLGDLSKAASGDLAGAKLEASPKRDDAAI